MRVLITGANGYVGTRLIDQLAKNNYSIIATARHADSVRFPIENADQLEVIEADFLVKESLKNLPKQIDVVYYLIHSMAQNKEDFTSLDKQAAENFVSYVNSTSCKQIIYLTGLVSTSNLSKHLASRLQVETILKQASSPLTSLRTGIIIGSGSASFEIIRDLTEKLPIMVAPKWVSRRCQPIAISDIIDYLIAVIDNQKCLNKTFDVGGPDILTYKELLLEYAKVRKLWRLIFTVPFFTPHLSSYWLILVTTTNYYLAQALVNSMKNDAVCQENEITKIIPKTCLTYKKALEKTFEKINTDQVLSTWKNTWSATGKVGHLTKKTYVPSHGCLSMESKIIFTGDPAKIFQEVLQIGDRKGWIYMNWAWRIRGLIDRLIGGVGINRGRRSKTELRAGDVIDFWRVLEVSKEDRSLKLLAEMKIPGDAWLLFNINQEENHYELIQTAVFRPKGVFGRVYWYAFYPIHLIMFPGMLKRLVKIKS